MKNSVGKMVTVQDGRPPVFDNYLIPPGEITLCATLRTDGYYYATSRECGNFKMCFVCSAPTEPVYTLKGTCRMSWFSFNYYLETTMDGKIQAFMGFSRKRVHCISMGKNRTSSNVLFKQKVYSVDD